MNEERPITVRITVKARNKQNAISLMNAATEAVQKAIQHSPPEVEPPTPAEDGQTVAREQLEAAVTADADRHLESLDQAAKQATAARPAETPAPPVDLAQANAGRKAIRDTVKSAVRQGWIFTVALYRVTVEAAVDALAKSGKGP